MQRIGAFLNYCEYPKMHLSLIIASIGNLMSFDILMNGLMSQTNW